MKRINYQKVKDFLQKRKKLIISVAVVFIIIGFFAFGGKNQDVTLTETVKYADLISRVRATGQVISNTNLDLSFNKSGIVKSVRVKVGDVVKAGQILATLDQRQAFASLTEARAALLGAKAKYNKILEGATNEEIILAEVALKNAEIELVNKKKTQAVLVENARQELLNSTIATTADAGSNSSTPPTITGTYVLSEEGDMKISTYLGGNGSYFNVSGLVSGSGIASTTTPQPIGNTGLYIQFVDSSSGQWVISIPNKKASDYLSNLSTYQNAKETETSVVEGAESLVAQRRAELNLKLASARPADLAIAQAEILSTEGALQSAESSYEDTIVRAPESGTITKVDIKYGELSESGKSVVTLEDVDNLYIEALINEANIAYLKNAQSVDVTFDAFGRDKKFMGMIAHINPSADTSDGIVNYKIQVALSEKDVTIRPGMNANIDILVGERKNVLVIPNIAVIKKDGGQYVKVLTDSQDKKYEERAVSTGFVGDNNLVEIQSGLLSGEVVFLK